MIQSLLPIPESPHARRDKVTGGYTYGLYKRDRVLAVAQSKEGLDAKRRWDETLRGNTPDPGWTTRLGDITGTLASTALAVGRILELLGYRSDRHVTDSAVAAGFGVRRWDGFAMHDDWHLERAVAAIGLAAQARGDTAVADALAAAIGRRQGRERLVARKRKQDEEKAALRQEGESVMTALQVELQSLRGSDPDMTLLDAVEFTTSDPSRRVALYRRCAEDGDIQARGLSQDDPRLLKIASSSALDLAFLERRARGEGFQVQG